ncbi:MAG: hypothetical protein R3E68_14260 [Burkholderiaceae bacterium]
MRLSRPSESPLPARTRASWPAWLALAGVGAVAAALVLLSITLRGHADDRRIVMERLTAMEVLAAGQNTLVWRAMTQLMADDQMAFARTRGQEQLRRRELLRHFERLHELETSGERWNARLGYAAQPQLLAALGERTDRFLGGVQSSLSQMHLSRTRMRERLDHWDMNYGYFTDTLGTVRSRNEKIALASAAIANRVTAAAALIALLTCGLFAASLAQVRARRTQELQSERLRSVAASESRFRELVQNSSDLILVLEADGGVRYATPSAAILQSSGVQLPATVSMAAGATSGKPPGDARVMIDDLIGLSAQQLVAQGRSEIRVDDRDGQGRTYEIQASDLTAHPDIHGIVLNGRDVTQAKALQDRLLHQALHDPLTGLPNRRSFTTSFDAMTDEQRQPLRAVHRPGWFQTGQ